MTIAAFMEPVVLEVYGIPQAQGSKTAFRNQHTGRMQVVEGKTKDARERFKDWREAVAQAARDWQAEHNAPLLDEACSVTIHFRLPRPPSIPKRRTRPDRGLDVDKMTRLVFDSLTGVLITNDARICEAHVRKTYAVDSPPGCTITLEVLD